MPSNREGGKSSKGAQGVRGKRGARGARGPRGVPGRSAADGDIVDRIARELETAQRELRVQFTRIAQLQAEIDELRAATKRAPAATD